MERTLVGRFGGSFGSGGYGILRCRGVEVFSIEFGCSAVPTLRHCVSSSSGPRPLRPTDCCWAELSRSVLVSTGFPNPGLGGGRNKVLGIQRKMADTTAEAATSEERVPVKTMKVVDHLVLFKMNVDELQEKEMLDGLYSLQYAIKDIITSSLGTLIAKTPEGYTHGLFTRFKSVQALKDYWVHEKKIEVSEQLVIPFFSEPNGLCMVDFEAEVENDLEAVFRRGDRFESGVEHFLIFKFKNGTPSEVVEESLNTIKSLRAKLGDEIVQTTIGVNIEERTTPFFSHGVVTRFESESSYYDFQKLLASEPSWTAVNNVIENHIEGSYIVEPIGNKLM